MTHLHTHTLVSVVQNRFLAKYIWNVVCQEWTFLFSQWNFLPPHMNVPVSSGSNELVSSYLQDTALVLQNTGCFFTQLPREFNVTAEFPGYLPFQSAFWTHQNINCLLRYPVFPQGYPWTDKSLEWTWPFSISFTFMLVSKLYLLRTAFLRFFLRLWVHFVVSLSYVKHCPLNREKSLCWTLNIRKSIWKKCFRYNDSQSQWHQILWK